MAKRKRTQAKIARAIRAKSGQTFFQNKHGKFISRAAFVKIPKSRRRGRVPKLKPTGGKRGRISRGEKIYQHKPQFNLCFSADRNDFYDTIGADYDRALASKRFTREEKSRLRVVVDVQGQIKYKNRKNRRRRTTNQYVGERRFKNFTNLRRFLTLDKGEHSGESESNPFGVKWDKEHMCQYQKSARLEIAPKRPGAKPKVVSKYKLES